MPNPRENLVMFHHIHISENGELREGVLTRLYIMCLSELINWGNK